jgi:hypothetical protein
MLTGRLVSKLISSIWPILDLSVRAEKVKNIYPVEAYKRCFAGFYGVLERSGFGDDFVRGKIFTVTLEALPEKE